MTERSPTLFEPGHQAEWARINREEAEQDAALIARYSLSERLELGQRLCDQAFDFLNAVRTSGHGPVADPRA